MLDSTQGHGWLIQKDAEAGPVAGQVFDGSAAGTFWKEALADRPIRLRKTQWALQDSNLGPIGYERRVEQSIEYKDVLPSDKPLELQGGGDLAERWSVCTATIYSLARSRKLESLGAINGRAHSSGKREPSDLLQVGATSTP